MKSIQKHITPPGVKLMQALFCLGQVPLAAPAKSSVIPQQAYMDFPLSFERQIKGTDERFVAQGNGYVIGLDRGRAVIGLPEAANAAKGTPGPGRFLSLDFIGGKGVTANPQDELQGKINRYPGNDPRRWQTGLSTYGKVSYHDVYLGHRHQFTMATRKQLEFDFSQLSRAPIRARSR